MVRPVRTILLGSLQSTCYLLPRGKADLSSTNIFVII
nr:MAG TPA: hypothetical protein [Caudoviricetes sp.]DAM86222.1 MAG TPA: hypothetical protein [Caudoviricetes sp.]DAR00940.1 MAG TPA: hypothetical protein [Crassvirales sp.]